MLQPIHTKPNRPTQNSSTGIKRLSVGLGDTLQLILLLDGVRVAAALGGVDQLLSEALGDGLDVAERGLAGTGGQESDSLVDTAERGHIDGLATDGTGGTDSGGILTGTAVDDSIDGDLDGVLIGHEVDLQRKKEIVSRLSLHI